MKKKVIIISVIILLLACLGGAWFFYQTRLPKLGTDKVVPFTPPAIKLKIIKVVNVKSNTRPIAVMINNHAAARANHAGLQDAYIVYEMVAEGGITRLMAVFKDASTAKIGSVRSARHYYIDYALENDAIYTHYGWSPQAESDVKSLKVTDINGLYDTPFWRDLNLNVDYEHTAFTSMEKLNTFIEQKGYRNTTDQPFLLDYSYDPIDLSKKDGNMLANNVNLPYSPYVTTTYIYDSEKNVYKRSVNGKAHTDGITKEQYTAKNIIVAKIKNYSIDSYGRQTLENIGTGDGYYITNGYAIPIKWSKSSRSSQTIYSYLDGTKITVNDGNTFIQNVPITSNVQIG